MKSGSGRSKGFVPTFTYSGRLIIVLSQVHIQQIGQRELKRANEIAQRTAVIKEKESALLKKHKIKAHL